MPQSLNLSTPPQASNKRQRSRDSRKEASRPGSAGQAAPPPPLPNDTECLARRGIRLPAYLNKTKSEITASFQDLEWKQRYRLAGAFQNPNSPFRIDRSESVVGRNRYTNVQPWDAARVRLQTPIGGSDYVNASPISLRSLSPGSPHRGQRKTSQQTSGSDTQSIHLQETRYIATQGPKEGQFSHFWHMAMQQTTGGVGVIVMLTQCYEGLKEKCAEYFPMDMETPMLELPPEPKNVESSQVDSDGDPFLDSDSGSADTDSSGAGTTANPSEAPEADGGAPFSAPAPAPTRSHTQEMTQPGTVELVSVRYDTNTGSEVRELKATIGDSSKTFYHFFYGKWADFGRIERDDRIALLQLTRQSKQIAGESPRIVHCSAGVGRTGTWIALDFLLRELEENRLLDQSYFDVHAEASRKNTSSDQLQQAHAGNGRMGSSPSRDTGRGTWGKSGPQKTTTPEPKENDLIHDTVDLLRTQRMMMVMNEIQYSSLYEVLRERFIDKYAEKEVGATITPAPADVEEPSPKTRRMSTHGSSSGLSAVMGELGMEIGMYEATKVGEVKGEEDTVSEAETEIEGADTKEDESGGGMRAGDGDDPYAAVSRENVMRRMEGEHEG